MLGVARKFPPAAYSCTYTNAPRVKGGGGIRINLWARIPQEWTCERGEAHVRPTDPRIISAFEARVRLTLSRFAFMIINNNLLPSSASSSKCYCCWCSQRFQLRINDLPSSKSQCWVMGRDSCLSLSLWGIWRRRFYSSKLLVIEFQCDGQSRL